MVLKIEDGCNDEIRKQLKKQGLWKGEAAMRDLLLDLDRVLRAVDAAGGEVDPEWPARLARLANLVLSARARGRLEAAIEDGGARAKD